MQNLLKLLIKTQSNSKSQKLSNSTSGFTMIELLVGTIIAFLIIVPMLTFVVDILNRDVREEAKTNGEQDIQAALDYIQQDLSQALYIYDQDGITTLLGNTPPPIPSDATSTPILVFWKRDVVEKAIPATTATTYANCNNDSADPCNDTYVMSLVAYYLVQDNNATWCEPGGTNCPARITRFEVKDGVRDPNNFSVYICDTGGNCDSDTPSGRRQRDPGFNTNYDLSNPTLLTGVDGEDLPRRDTLVNYIDQSTANVPTVTEADCDNAVGSTGNTISTTNLINEATISGAASPTNSFYACVNAEQNLARVYLRGNSLRRIQTDATYSQDRATYFPSGTVQVEGQSGL
ncbi:hormogonium polysaccharide secretion pseudopilin HpsC [Dapis sp. BLCC M172]|uniref:hormogonium polysaccharide secretion pseudopilin HpsC n=1 Tax=Dapis sp. BLCC M172 TaxID=2975281 RepID=UPI003CF8EC2B